MDRRELLGGVAAAAAAVSLAKAGDERAEPRIVDTNVNLFPWPFRRLPHDQPAELAAKLRAGGISRAWASSFEGILHRDLAGVNQRLAEACREQGAGRLVPIGAVNLELPDWEEDVRRCHEQHGMPGIRLHPGYHGYPLDDARFERLLRLAAERKLLVQLATTLEDTRTQHPRMRAAEVALGPLPELLTKRAPQCRVQLLNWRPTLAALTPLSRVANLFFDVARVESTDGIAELLRRVPAERVALGSHAPFLILEAVLIRVDEAALTAPQRASLLHAAADRLLAASAP